MLSRIGWTKWTTAGPTIEACIAHGGRISTPPHVCVALVSKSFPDYTAVTRSIAEYLRPTYTIGCVVDHVPGVKHGISLMTTSDERVVPFHVPDSPERHKIRNISVGRWGRQDLTGEWIQFGSISKPSQEFRLPSTLQQQKEHPSFVFVASDNEPDQLLHSLDHHFPQSTKIGIIGASTPFVTGNPFALFCQQEMLSAGMVGFAAYDNNMGQDISIEHPSLETLGEPMTITRCRGNIILDLDQAGATGLLLELIKQGQSARIAKDQEFYLGIYPPGTQDPSQMSVNRVTSGDPSRGNMSIDTTADLQVGQIVQFMKRKPIEHPVLGTGDSIFGVVDKDHTIDTHRVAMPQEAKSLPDVFGGASENGIIVGRPGLASSILDVPYSIARFVM
ncbi:hypothetical protein O0I10_000305 [Lichtheimia ornata]|uniref:FIST domain-containing protein n=1 Tax=Lichtheimia ornata TaxID=688661 RepID=A0AAD7Y560_9FUNG|nr:uncharacterized protein O0I10_000305 [Lichtheimia ornata]KAJ8664027.1 hypothetical protein O0I10_000305 [Lichtheimia ornata]